MRIAILPTGRMEWEALPQTLQSLFPHHEFYSLPTETEIESYGEDFPAHSFTSCDVTKLSGKANKADKLIERAAAEAIGDSKRDRKAADMVIILDDLEIINLHQASAVVEVVREASQRFLDQFLNESNRRDRYAVALKNKVSFHLAKPMIESWLFSDWENLKNACKPTGTAKLKEGVDPECFLTNDPVYETDTGANCNKWIEKKRKDHIPQWIKAGDHRNIHPKAYLSWLCIKSDEKNCSSYSETDGGVNALKCLEWVKLFQNQNHACYARSMIQDIANAINEDNPFPGMTALETNLLDVRQRILRNL
ncbi:MAG: hypothetical protein NTX45_09810 [Proteobacteria bacterium]|nr:hypothetical protein [Pseudomonadota bacterium]